MSKKALWKNIIKEIQSTFGRFISIFLLIALGVFVFVGLNVTGEDIRVTALDYVQEQQLADVFIQSNYGITTDDTKVLNDITQFSRIEYGYAFDSLVKNNRFNNSEQETIRIYSLPQQLSRYRVLEGRLPEHNNEVVIDYLLQDTEQYSIGDTVTLYNADGEINDEYVHESTFTIVGIVSSPEFLVQESRGQTNVGSGMLEGFMASPSTNFDMEVYTTAKASLNGLTASKYDKASYDTQVSAIINEVEQIIDQKNLADIRMTTIRAEMTKQITDAQKQLQEGKDQLAEARLQLENGEVELNQAKVTYTEQEQLFWQTLTEKEAELAVAQQQLDAATIEINAAEAELEHQASVLQEQADILSSYWQTWQQSQDQLDDAIARVQQEEQELLAAQQIVEHEMQLSEARIAELEAIIASGGGTAEIQAELIATQQQLAQQEMNLQDLLEQQQALTIIKLQQQAVQEQLTEQREQLQQQQEQLDAARGVLQAAQQAFNQQYQIYEQGRVELATGYRLLAEAKDDGQQQLATAWNQIQAAERDLINGQEQFETERVKAEQEFADAEIKIQDAKASLAKLKKPNYMVQSRLSLYGYDEYFENTVRLDTLAYIFPVFFFFVALLVVLTTMTRMVEEQRTQIGTLKALGYSNQDITKKYFVYGLVSGLSGSIVGIILGFYVLPPVIYSAYTGAYIFKTVTLRVYWNYAIIALVIALSCTLLPAILTIRAELKAKTTDLMRPKAPKISKKILLERIGFIWKRLSFNYKVTARNIFRYKQRMFMTIFGIAGCMALIIVGFGIYDSLETTVSVQFNDLYHYDVLTVFDPDVKDLSEYNQALATPEQIKDYQAIVYDQAETATSSAAKQDFDIIVPEHPEMLSGYISLIDTTTKQPITPNETGAVISAKLASLLQLQVGDVLRIKYEDNQYDVPIQAINQWYTGHQMIMSPQVYQQIFKTAPKYNANVVHVSDGVNIDAVTETLNKQPGSISAIKFANSSEMIEETLNGLSLVMSVLVFCAILLAIIVLYNLNNINVSERIRELSTIKVLGFYPQEVTLYIYRETLFLTIIGIIIGFFMGTALEQYIIRVLPPSIVMFDTAIRMTNYSLSAAITIIVSIMVMIVMHYKLKKVDMIEALKSVE